MTTRPKPNAAEEAPTAADAAESPQAQSSTAAGPSSEPHSLSHLGGIEVKAAVELGSTELLLRDLAALEPGSVVRLDRLTGDPADFTVNGHLFARGELVLVGENLGLRITDLVDADGPP